MTERHYNSVVNCCKVEYFGIRIIRSSKDFYLAINIHENLIKGGHPRPCENQEIFQILSKDKYVFLMIKKKSDIL